MERSREEFGGEGIGCCVYCGLITPGCRDENCLKCSLCKTTVHFTCLKKNVKMPESGLSGDVFYKFTCKSCSVTHCEQVSREKMSWLTVLVVALYNLKELPHLSRHGFYHWKLHIADFIDRKWNYIFGSSIRRKRAWHGTVSGTLSHYSPSFFQTGTHVLRESGWWKLTHDNMSPFNTIQLKQDGALYQGRPLAVRTEKEEGLTEEDSRSLQESHLSNASCSLDADDSISPDFDGDMLSFSDSEGFDVDIDLPIDIEKEQAFPSMESELSELVDQYVSTGDVHSISPSSMHTMIKVEHNSTSERDSDDSSDSNVDFPEPPKSLFNIKKYRSFPWLNKCISSVSKSDGCLPMTEYEELHLLHMLSKHSSGEVGSVPKEILRLRRKLIVRREQRHKRLGMFSEILSTTCDASISSNNVLKKIMTRTLDRYQVHNVHDESQKSSSGPQSFILRLRGEVELTCFVSPYTERVLKPFIRRDFDSQPLRLNLLAEIQSKVLNKVYKRYPIDYSYVQPHHIPAINSLCELYFWPGIDLTESLMYPDFSCVALYRKIIIGFAFLVPDVSNNESYISFLFTHPEWRRAGIATFMLYHLIQTCMGKDITLHVSVTNPAVILYQKFGFKVEELVQDFYDKYLPTDSKDCKHALFLRLSR